MRTALQDRVEAKSVLLDGTVMLTTPAFTLTPLLTPIYM